ncbi:SAM-dependent methyltransferase [Nakamurella sp. UYEF19]|uniref:class I SAM-dependent methyltransferase n=1 Tax=Nakamurella sp. UYEF19 TaxID=1756392 RepID=UPI003398643F
MASNRPATKGRSAADPADAAAMSLMARIAERAGSVRALVRRTPPPPPAPAPGAGVTTAQLVNARLLLSEQNIVGPTRMRFAKRLLMRSSRLYTHKLVRAGQDLADAIEMLEITHGRALGEMRNQLDTGSASGNASMVDRVAKLELDLGRLSNSLHAQLTSVELGVDDVAESVEKVTENVAGSVGGLTELIAQTTASLKEDDHAMHENARGLDVRLSAMERTALHDRSELHRTRTLVSRLVRTASAQIGTPPGITQDAVPSALKAGPVLEPGIPATLDDSTYVDFEHRFRGTRDEIRARQQDAVPFVSGFAGSTSPVLDLGCGRGEWLDLLDELSVKAYGVDSNTAMVAEALDAGLDARVGDALAHLEQLPESSLQAVTAFQFVEHIPMDVLVRLLDSALLALRPGGVLLLETPNPTNLIVGAANFYLDPTHLRVLHPDFLAFLVESRGFVDVEVHYVHPVIEDSVLKEGDPENGEADARLSRVVRNVEWALFGPQDYLVHARRAEVA